MRYVVRLRTIIKDVSPEFPATVLSELLKVNEESDMVADPEQDDRFTFWVTVNSESVDQAVLMGTAIIRTAAHAAGGATPDWPKPEDWPDKWPHGVFAHAVEAYADPELVGA